MVVTTADQSSIQQASARELKVTWFESWNPSLDEALQTLPEMDCCPHELYRLLFQNPGPVPKRAALVTKDGIPVAIVGLRQKGRLSWEPLTQWIIPGAIFPAQPGYHIPSLEALGVDVQVAWWRMDAAPLQSSLMHSVRRIPTYRMHLSQDYENFWRENKHFRHVRNARNRCQKFTHAVNAPGAAEWTIKNWESRWRVHPDRVDPALEDRLVAAKYLEKHAKHITITILDRDIPIGGETMYIHNGDLVDGVVYRLPEYDWYGVGTRLFDLAFSFAVESGFKVYDIGGGEDYKRHWAPQEGEHWLLSMCPGPLFQVKQIVNWVRDVRRRYLNFEAFRR